MNAYQVEYEWTKDNKSGNVNKGTGCFTTKAKTPDEAIRKARTAFKRQFQPFGYRALSYSVSSDSTIAALFVASDKTC